MRNKSRLVIPGSGVRVRTVTSAPATNTLVLTVTRSYVRAAVESQFQLLGSVALSARPVSDHLYFILFIFL